MTEETTPKKRGRPVKPKDKKVELKFHLVLLNEEMELFNAAAEALRLTSTAVFVRDAIDEAGVSSAILKSIPKGLAPSPEDKTSKHYIFFLSDATRAIVDREDPRGHSDFIRAAALSKVFRDKAKSPAVDAALAALKLKKGVK